MATKHVKRWQSRRKARHVQPPWRSRCWFLLLVGQLSGWCGRSRLRQVQPPLTFHRGTTTREPIWRSLTGIFRGWHDGAVDHGPCQSRLSACDLPNFRDALQRHKEGPAGDCQSLVEASRRGMVSSPNEWTEHYNLGVGYEGTGKLLEAISEYQKAIEISNGDHDATASLAHAFAVIGRRAEAEKILHDFERKSKSGYVSPYRMATIYAGLGERDKAFEFLERAYQERSLDISWHLKADLRIDNLRSDPRFQDLVRRV